MIVRVTDTDRLTAALELFEFVAPGAMRRGGRDQRHFADLLRSGRGVVLTAEDRDGIHGVFLGTPRSDRLYYDAVVAPGVDAPPVIADLVDAGAAAAAGFGYLQLFSHEPVDGALLYESLDHVPTLRVQFNDGNRVERRKALVREFSDHRLLTLGGNDEWVDATFRIDRVDFALRDSVQNAYAMHLMHRWTDDRRPRYVMTAHHRFHRAAVGELRAIDPELATTRPLNSDAVELRAGRPGHDLRPAITARPVTFARAIATPDLTIRLDGTRTDIQRIAEHAAELALDPARTLAVECRKADVTVAGPHQTSAYTVRDIEIGVGTALAVNYAIDLDSPGQVVSIFLAADEALLGVDTTFADRLRRTGPTVISRAEHKLAEALDLFGVGTRVGSRALDLGAAPGGWTYLLAERGVSVTAVDPGNLAERVASHPNVTHVRDRAENLVGQGIYDLVVNDMNLDPTDSAAITCAVAPLLMQNGLAVLTIKLPGRPMRGIRQAIDVLEPIYDVLAIRHLPHNRQEVTALLRINETPGKTRPRS